MAESEISIDTAKTLFSEYSEKIAELNAQMKPLKKELKKYEKVIISYMNEHELASFDVGNYTFETKSSSRFRITKEDLLELLEDPQDVEQFCVESNSIAKSKKRARRE